MAVSDAGPLRVVMVQLPGMHKVRAKGRAYYYAWRGGPRLPGKPGSPEFICAYVDACAARQNGDGDARCINVASSTNEPNAA